MGRADSSPGQTRPGDDGYQRAARRTAAEPLAASWRPKPDAEGPRRDGRSGRGKARRRRGLLATYGWWAYALPILIVVTALAVLDVARPLANQGPQAIDSPDVEQSDGNGNTVAQPGPTVIGEAPPGNKVELNIPGAELPSGAPITESGQQKWHVLRGTSEPFGTGPKTYTYMIEVEDGIDASSFGGEDSFASVVDATLRNPKSWTGSGEIKLRRVDSGTPDMRISLTTPLTTRRPDLCNYLIRYEASCYNGNTKRVVINLARWVRGSVAYEGDTGGYRQYAINHEVGHFFKKQHQGCDVTGNLASVMMQQSFGVDNNYVWELNQVDPDNRTKVAKDGKVCRPNPWPFPANG